MGLWRSIYQGALAAGWQPFEYLYGEQRWLPGDALAFCHPDRSYRGVVFARPDGRTSMARMLDLHDQGLNHGLELCWLMPVLPNFWPQRVMMAGLGGDGLIRPQGEAPLLAAEFAEQALLDWPDWRQRLRPRRMLQRRQRMGMAGGGAAWPRPMIPVLRAAPDRQEGQRV